ncbi:hypothetical protein LINPERHAP2_LOCUS17051, partial [Linum perenne]
YPQSLFLLLIDIITSSRVIHRVSCLSRSLPLPSTINKSLSIRARSCCDAVLITVLP